MKQENFEDRIINIIDSGN